MWSKSKNTILQHKIKHLYKELGEILQLAAEKPEVRQEEDDLYVDMSNLYNHLEEIGYQDFDVSKL